MVAPTGVSGGIPQDPAEAAAAAVELAGASATEAEPAQSKPAGSEPAGSEPAADDTAEAEPTEGDTAEAEPAADDSTEAESAADDSTEAEPAEGELTGAGAGGQAGDAAEGSRDFSPLAVAGIILVVLVLVGVAVGVLDAVTHGFRPKTMITYRPAAVFGLRPGDCINSGANALNVTVVSCSTPHDAEVFATFSLPETSWPGDSVAQLDASDGCVSRLDAYLNPQLATADLTQEYVYPNQAAWRAGEHTVVCEVRAVSGPLTGSVRAQS